jgi:hypothetical protein
MTAATDQLPTRVAEVRIRETSPAHMLKVIADAAANPECDAGKMKALHDLMKDVYEFEGKKAFTRAFNALQDELPAIDRDGRIDHSSDGGERTRSGKKALKTGYSTYPNIMRVVKPLLKKYGFTLSNVIEPTADGARIHVVGYLEHIEGHSRISRFPMSIDTTGGKNNQQGWGSSQEYGRRYNAIALLNIVSEAPQDQDNDGFERDKRAGWRLPGRSGDARGGDQRRSDHKAARGDRGLRRAGGEGARQIPYREAEGFAGGEVQRRAGGLQALRGAGPWLDRH